MEHESGPTRWETLYGRTFEESAESDDSDIEEWIQKVKDRSRKAASKAGSLMRWSLLLDVGGLGKNLTQQVVIKARVTDPNLDKVLGASVEGKVSDPGDYKNRSAAGRPILNQNEKKPSKRKPSKSKPTRSQATRQTLEPLKPQRIIKKRKPSPLSSRRALGRIVKSGKNILKSENGLVEDGHALHRVKEHKREKGEKAWEEAATMGSEYWNLVTLRRYMLGMVRVLKKKRARREALREKVERLRSRHQVLHHLRRWIAQREVKVAKRALAEKQEKEAEERRAEIERKRLEEKRREQERRRFAEEARQKHLRDLDQKCELFESMTRSKFLRGHWKSWVVVARVKREEAEIKAKRASRLKEMGELVMALQGRGADKKSSSSSSEARKGSKAYIKKELDSRVLFDSRGLSNTSKRSAESLELKSEPLLASVVSDAKQGFLCPSTSCTTTPTPKRDSLTIGDRSPKLSTARPSTPTSELPTSVVDSPTDRSRRPSPSRVQKSTPKPISPGPSTPRERPTSTSRPLVDRPRRSKSTSKPLNTRTSTRGPPSSVRAPKSTSKVPNRPSTPRSRPPPSISKRSSAHNRSFSGKSRSTGLSGMDERAATRREKRRELKIQYKMKSHRRRQEEASKERRRQAKKVASLKNQRRKRLEKEAREKQKRKVIAKRKRIAEQKRALAGMHHMRSIVIFNGWKPWCRFIRQIRLQMEKAAAFDKYCAVRRVFSTWVHMLQVERFEKKSKVMRFRLRLFIVKWRRTISMLREKQGLAWEHHCRHLSRVALKKWGAQLRIRQDMKLAEMVHFENLAVSQHKTFLLRSTLQMWKEALGRKRMEKQKEDRFNELNDQVAGWLSDLQTANEPSIKDPESNLVDVEVLDDIFTMSDIADVDLDLEELENLESIIN